jgi:predicted nucleic acid-binding protein
MKLVVTDTNVLIDVLDCHLVQAFFDLPLEIHTTEFILAELNEIQRAALIPFVATDHLKVKMFDELEMRAIMEFPVTRMGVQRRIADRSALYLAVCWGAVLLGGDNDLRKEAEERQVEVHGSIWLFEVLFHHGVKTAEQTKNNLERLMDVNPRIPVDLVRQTIQNIG